MAPYVQNLRTRTVTSGSVFGHANRIGYGTGNFSVNGSNNYLPDCSRNLVVYGNDFNRYADGQNERDFVSNPLITVTVDELVSLAGKGSIGRYAVVSDGVEQVTIGETTVQLNPNGLTAYVTVTGLNQVVAGVPDYVPSNCNNILSIGNGISISTNDVDSVIIGDNVRMPNTYLLKSVIHDRDVSISGSAYIRNVWWIGDGSRGARKSPLEGINERMPGSRQYEDAFVFSTTRLDISEFYGIFTDPVSQQWGFTDETAPYACKPGTSMVYAGGIALGGIGRVEGKYSDYGLLKIGSNFRSASYVRSWKERSDLFGKNWQPHFLCTGTTDCLYAGMTLVIQDDQEWDGTYRIKPQKIDSRGLDMDEISQKLGSREGGILSKFGISAYISTTVNTDLYTKETAGPFKPDDDVSGAGYTTTTYTLTGIQHGGIYRVAINNQTGIYTYTDAEGEDVQYKYPQQIVKLPTPTADDVGKQFIVVLTVGEWEIEGRDRLNTVFYKGMSFNEDTSTFAAGAAAGNTLNYLLPPASLNSLANGFAGMRNLIDSLGVSGDKTAPTQNALLCTANMHFATLFNVVQIPRMENGSRYDDTNMEYCYIPQSLGLIPFHNMNKEIT